MKIFNRDPENYEIVIAIVGIILGLFILIINTALVSPEFFGLHPDSANPRSLLFSIVLLVLSGILIRQEKKAYIVSTIIVLLSLALILNSVNPLTTTFSPEFGKLPITIEDCRVVGGVLIPNTLDCANNYVESSNIGDMICCIPDNCEWERVYNQETKIYEKVCK